MKAITILDVALGRGAKADENGGLTMSEFDRLGLPMIGGCQCCGATIAAYNASPSTTGYLRCAESCIGDLGFPTVRAFEAWSAYQDALCEASAEECEG